MKFKTGDKVKVISLNNTFTYLLVNKEFITFLNKTFTVRDTFTICDLQNKKHYYIAVEENTYHWNMKDLILINNTLEIE
jgi:hypothetical protein